MTLTALALPLFLLTLAVIVLWMLIGSRGPWYLKVFLIMLLPVSTVVIWTSVHSYLGWPAPAPASGKFVLIAAVVREPAKATGDSGGVFLWVRPARPSGSAVLSWIGYHADPQAPRAYKLPYSRELHQAVSKAQGRVKEGRTVVGQFKDGGLVTGKGDGDGDATTDTDDPDGADGRPGRGRGNGAGTRGGGDEMFYELPPSHPQEKTPE